MKRTKDLSPLRETTLRWARSNCKRKMRKGKKEKSYRKERICPTTSKAKEKGKLIRVSRHGILSKEEGQNSENPVSPGVRAVRPARALADLQSRRSNR